MAEATAKKKKGPKRSSGVEIAPGIEVPEGVNRYRVMRCDAIHPFLAKRPVAIPLAGMRVDMFDLAKGLPTVDYVKHTWGSGAYRFAWWRDSKPAGLSPHFVIDDPAFPAKPDYTPEAAPTAVRAAAPEPAANPLLEVLKTQADGAGKVDLTTTLVILQAMAAQERSMRNDQEERDRRWRAEDERRARQREEEHARDLEKIRAQSEADRKAQEEFWERQNEAAVELRRASRGEDVDEELGSLGEAVQSLAEAQKETAKQSQDMWSKVFEMVAPAVPGLISKFTGGAAPPNGAK
jgi:hypothetical protein